MNETAPTPPNGSNGREAQILRLPVARRRAYPRAALVLVVTAVAAVVVAVADPATRGVPLALLTITLGLVLGLRIVRDERERRRQMAALRRKGGNKGTTRRP